MKNEKYIFNRNDLKVLIYDINGKAVKPILLCASFNKEF